MTGSGAGTPRTLDAAWAITWLRTAAAEVSRRRGELGELDRQIGDGDHGANMHRGFTAVVARLEELQSPPAQVGQVLTLAADALMSTVGGAAGPLYASALARAGAATPVAELEAPGVAALLSAALAGVVARGEAAPGDKTMVDALAPAAAAARRSAADGAGPVQVLAAAAAAAEAGAAATEPLLATRGRASYLGERSVGHLDPGAVSCALLLRAAVDAARGPARPTAPGHRGLEDGAQPDRVPRQVAVVLVSHSTALADGLVELAGQMAPDVVLLAAGGQGDGTLGTSAERVRQAIDRAASGGWPVVVLADLGSAVLTTAMVLEGCDREVAGHVRLAPGPFVEGAVAAAVAAQGGAGLDGVCDAVADAGRLLAGAVTAASPRGEGVDGVVSRVVMLRNPLGLHARPAAVLARLVAGFDAQVQVDGVNAASVLELMRLAAAHGERLTIEASGVEAEQAVRAVAEAIEEGFGEA